MRTRHFAATILAAALLSPASAPAAPANIINAQLTSRAVSGPLERVIDPDTKVKTQALFGLSQLPPDEGVPVMIQIAKTNRNAAVRKQAMFWLGQSKDARALAFFEEVLIGAKAR